MRFLIIIFSFVSISSVAGDSLKCKKPQKFYVDVAGGIGGFLFGDGYALALDQIDLEKFEGIGTYKLSTASNIKLNCGIKLVQRDCKIRSGMVHFLYCGIGINSFNYSIDHTFGSYYSYQIGLQRRSMYKKADIKYTISKFNYSIFLSAGVIGPKGFFIRNALGVSYATYLNKRTYENTMYTYYGTSISSTPDKYTTFTEKNYYSDDLNLFYNMNLGYKIKNTIPYFYGELNCINEDLMHFYTCGMGVMIVF